MDGKDGFTEADVSCWILPQTLNGEDCHSGETLKSVIPGPGRGAGMVREQSCSSISVSIINVCVHIHTPSDNSLWSCSDSTSASLLGLAIPLITSVLGFQSDGNNRVASMFSTRRPWLWTEHSFPCSVPPIRLCDSWPLWEKFHCR